MRGLGASNCNAKTGEIRPLFTYTDSNGQFFAAMGPADFAKDLQRHHSDDNHPVRGNEHRDRGAKQLVNLQDADRFSGNDFGLPATRYYLHGDPGQCPLNVILNGLDFPGNGSR